MKEESTTNSNCRLEELQLRELTHQFIQNCIQRGKRYRKGQSILRQSNFRTYYKNQYKCWWEKGAAGAHIVVVGSQAMRLLGNTDDILKGQTIPATQQQHLC